MVHSHNRFILLDSSAQEEIDLRVSKYIPCVFSASTSFLNLMVEKKAVLDNDILPFLKKHDIVKHVAEIDAIFCLLGYEWQLRKFLNENSEEDLKERQLHDNEINKLKNAFKVAEGQDANYHPFNEICMVIDGQKVKITNPILLNEFANCFDLDNYRKYLKSKSLRKLSPKERKSSNYKEFVTVYLFGLLNYLQKETSFGEKTKADTIRFIVDFSKLFGMDWKNDGIIMFPFLGNEPFVYLTDSFKKVTRS